MQNRLKYTACQKVHFTGAGEPRKGTIDCGISGNAVEGHPDEFPRYDIEDEQGRLFCGVPEVQIHRLQAVPVNSNLLGMTDPANV